MHLQTSANTIIDRVALATIEAVGELSACSAWRKGIKTEDTDWLAKNTKVCKFNVGTELRQVFGLLCAMCWPATPSV